MRCLIAAFCLFALCASAQDPASMFQDFQAKYGRQYESKAEEQKRFGIFLENMKTMKALNELNPKATFGVNGFADMTAAEFKVYHSADAHYKASAAKRGEEVEEKVAAGKSVDWRKRGAVTHVKNQAQCGSCWSFSTTGGIEGQWFLAGHKLVSLSEQELVSCDTIDSGCKGGIMQNAFHWLLSEKNGSIVTAASYPYVSGEGQVPACDCCGDKKFGAQISGFVNVKKTEQAMGDWVYANGPLSIAVDASSWKMYSGGIMTNCASKQVDHGVLIVGFNDAAETPYWIVKNSWGPGWGEEGYIRVEKGTDQCLITYDPTSSVVSSHHGPTNQPTNKPDTPSPLPANSFVTKTCVTPDCNNCKEVSHPQNVCIQAGSFSFKAACGTDALVLQTYQTADCSGSYTLTSEAINTCEVVLGRHGLNTYSQNVCPRVVPPTSVPTFAPTPAPQATFTQKVCGTSNCTEGCQSHTLPQKKCLSLGNGESATAVCTSTALVLTTYPLSADCTGFSVPVSNPINQCLKDTNGNYLENICSTAEIRMAADRTIKRLVKRV